MLHARKKMVPHILPNCSTTIPNKSGDDSGRELTSPRHRRGSGEPGDKYVHQKHNGSHAILDNTIEMLRTASGNSLTNGSAPLEEEEIVSDTEPLLQQQHREASRKLEGDLDDGPEFEFRSPPPETEETALTIALQVFVPYLIAGFGTVGAGLVLDVVQHWEVFVKVSEVFILVPALLGLKGNLEMTLASRLSTQANLGNMDKASEQWKMIGGNLALTQAQAIIVGFLAAIAAMVMGWIPEGKFSLSHALLLSASSALTASLASLVLGIVMIGVVLLSRKCGINPDNVATPIAASLGDLTTLSFLASISMVLFKAIGQQVWLSPLVVSLCLVVTPVWLVVAYRNKYTHEVVYTGWTPIICAMVISSVGGLVLDFAVSNFHGIAVFQPVINGVGGNLVAVQASRLSTALHKVSVPGRLPEGSHRGCANPFSVFFGKGMSPKTVRVLILMVIPGHLIFIYTIAFMSAGHTSITWRFALVYLSAAIIQVAILLYIAIWMVHYMWKNGDDPDNFAIPYLTALGDLLGTGLLAVVFLILYSVGDKDADVGD